MKRTIHFEHKIVYINAVVVKRFKDKDLAIKSSKNVDPLKALSNTILEVYTDNNGTHALKV